MYARFIIIIIIVISVSFKRLSSFVWRKAFGFYRSMFQFFFSFCMQQANNTYTRKYSTYTKHIQIHWPSTTFSGFANTAIVNKTGWKQFRNGKRCTQTVKMWWFTVPIMLLGVFICWLRRQWWRPSQLERLRRERILTTHTLDEIAWVWVAKHYHRYIIWNGAMDMFMRFRFARSTSSRSSSVDGRHNAHVKDVSISSIALSHPWIVSFCRLK